MVNNWKIKKNKLQSPIYQLTRKGLDPNWIIENSIDDLDGVSKKNSTLNNTVSKEFFERE